MASAPPWTALSRALGGVEVQHHLISWNASGRLAVVDLPEPVYRRYEGEVVRMTSVVTIGRFRYREISEATVKSGARLRIEGGVISPEEIEDTPTGIRVTARVDSIGDRSWWFTPPGPWFLRSPGRRQAVHLFGRPNLFSAFQSLGRPGLSLAARSLAPGWASSARVQFEYRQVPEGPGMVNFDAAWLANTVLVRLNEESRGVVTCRLKIDEFVLGAIGK